ncbi:MAG: VOC family protein [Fimbriimonadaceae bacterium]|nr:VOC family protein [Fimbriimonadaceae bacterium]
MDLGWLDVCLRVADVSHSRRFYESLGFVRVEGDDNEGWAVVVHGESRIGLYESQHVGDVPITLNFRGGDVLSVSDHLKAMGATFTVEPVAHARGGASATVLDPDGHPIFLDAAAGETKKVP